MVNDARMAPEVYGVIAAFHEAFADAWVARQVGPYMSCAEADALAEVLRLVDPGAGTAFLYGHANGEGGNSDENAADAHYWLKDEYDPAVNDADHLVHPGEDGRCVECAQPFHEHNEVLSHTGLDEEDRERMRRLGQR